MIGILVSLLLITVPTGPDVALIAIPRSPTALRILRGPEFLPRALMTEHVIAEAEPGGRAKLTAGGIDAEVLIAPGEPDHTHELYLVTPPLETRHDRAADQLAEYGRVLLADDGAFLLLIREELVRQLPPLGYALARVGTDRIVLPDPVDFTPAHAPGAVRLDWNPVIDSIINRITPTELATLLRQLSGEVPVMVRGRPDTIRTRHTSTARNSVAAWFLHERFAGYGLDSVNFQLYTADSNVIATRNGTTWPRKYWIIGGHFDNTSEQSAVWAPGADDNGTGTVMALIAAKYLAPYRFRYTIKFLGWNGEEQGLLGSAAHAQLAFNRGDTILGILNGDMIAGNGTGQDSLRLFHGNRPGTVAIVDTLLRCNTIYGIGLNPALRTTMPANSDHYSYYARGYNALMGIEKDFSPVYHSTGDRISDANFDTVYFCKVVRAYVATLATLAEFGSVQDAGVTALVAPTGLLDSSAAIVPRARVRNCSPGPVTFTTFLAIDSLGGIVYRDCREIVALAANAETTLSFSEWLKPHPAGRYALRCSTYLPGDSNPDNDVLADSFTVFALPIETGWVRQPDLPAGPSGRSVRDGGALACDNPSDPSDIFSLKGNNTCEFYAYRPITNAWVTLESIPRIGASGRKKGVKKGSVLCAAGMLYAAKGNNSLEFWGFDPSDRSDWSNESDRSSSWLQFADVPAGAKKVREGTGAAAVTLGDTTYIYLLKGSGTTEFYRYNTQSGIWETCPAAPLGLSGKPYKNGSAITSDGFATIYVVKGSYNEFHAYNAATRMWETRAMLPFVGSSGRKKKAKDGAGLAYVTPADRSDLFALKGGNTLEFWSYSIDSDAWHQLPSMPFGAGRNVKGGGALVSAAGFNSLYALKGNKTNEFYRYGLPAYSSLPAAYSPEASAQSSLFTLQSSIINLRIVPNPLRGSELPLAISYCLPRPGNISLKLYDISGKLVMTLERAYRSAGTRVLTIANLHAARGVYLLELKTENSTVTAKLVVE